MPVLKTEVETETMTRFKQIAKAQGLTVAGLLRSAVLIMTEQSGESIDKAVPDTENTEQGRMTVWMPQFIIEASKKKAKAKGMATGRWVAALVQSNLMKHPVMTDKELIELQAANRELAAVGRNINQIARAINEAFYETERVRLDKLEELHLAIEKTRSGIRGLVRASKNVWSAE